MEPVIQQLNPWLGLVPPDRLTRLYAQISDLLDQIDELEGKPSGQSWRDHLAFDSSPRVAFPIRWQEIDAKKIDRFSSMLSGPLFTSIEYPWPKLSEWRHGAKVPIEGFCEPILQIDMDLISRSARRSFASGMVQVWMDDQDSKVRFVPSIALNENSLTPVSEEISDFFASGVPTERNTYREWADDNSVAPWFQRALLFDRLGEPFHEYPEALEHFIEDLERNNLDMPDSELGRLTSIASDLHHELCETDSLLMHGNDSRASYWPEDCESGTFFGRFRSVQDGPFDFFRSPAIPLIDLGNWNTKFYWGDGTAQLLTSSAEPGAEFRFEWSTS